MDDYDGMHVEDENKDLYRQDFLIVILELSGLTQIASICWYILFENHCMFIGQLGPI